MPSSVRPSAALVAALVLAAGCSRPASTAAPNGGATPSNAPAEQAPAPRTPTPGTPGDTTRPPGGAGAPLGAAQAQGEPNPRPYERVVTREARTRPGLFTTHRVRSRLFYEIPRAQLGKDMLLVTQIAKTTLGAGYGGQAAGNRVLRWERRPGEHRILLRQVSYSVVADTSLPVYAAVQASNYDPIIASFNVEAYGPDSAAVIDVTRLFTSPPAELAARQLRGTVDPSRTFLERVASFPENIEVESTVTVNIAPPPAPPGAPQNPFGPPPPTTATVLMHWSMVKLPETPMMARLEDDRVGYFTTTKIDYGRVDQRAARRSYILRWRLEKKDPGAAISEPVKPITYYVDPATPKQWVPWIRKGIEDWQVAFEAAGFRRAIVAAEAPTRAQDPDWSAEDARYSVIRWLPSTIENASGPNVHDPRSGEILESDIQFYHNVQNLARTWYWTQVGALDPRAKTFPLPDSLMGELIRYVVAHEVGHTLGFPHNMKASSTYPIDSIRSASFVKRMGHTPTLMDYSRFNYVAQPEDGIAPADLIPKIGPYDVFATKWGYAPIPEAKTPDEERAILSQWAREQDAKPWLRFSTSGANGADPGEQTEAVGDIDAVRATTLGLRNIRRLVPMLRTATVKETENYDELEQLYERLVDQWAREMVHVTSIVGGAESQEKYGAQEGVRFTPVPEARQKAAVQFLARNAFTTPDYFLDVETLRRIEPAGAMERIGQAQRRVLTALLGDARLARLVEHEALADGRPGYTLAEMVRDVRTGLFSELTGTPRVDAFRRNLQRAFLDAVDTKLNPPVRPAGPTPPVVPVGPGAQPPVPTPEEARALLRLELRDLDAAVRSAVPRASDRTTRAHLEDLRVRIARILDPEGRR